MRNMKVVDTREYVGMLKELTEEGKEVSMMVFGSSMAPFLIHARDMIYFKRPDRELQKVILYFSEKERAVRHAPDMEDQAGGVLYRGRCTDTDRRTGKERADICPDHQSQKKRKVAGAGRFLVGILRHVWLHMIPLRRRIMWCYAKVIK